MLSRNDLQQIREVVREEVTAQTDPIKQDVSGLKQDVSGLKQDVSGLKQDVSGLKQDMVYVKKTLRGLKMKTTWIKNTLSVAIDVFDRRDLENKKSIHRIEEHLGLSS